MRTIAFLVYPQFQLLDLSGPLAVFQIANRIAGQISASSPQCPPGHDFSEFSARVAAPLTTAASISPRRGAARSQATAARPSGIDTAAPSGPASPYRLQVVSPGGGAITSSAGLEVLTMPVHDLSCDTLIVAGGPGASLAGKAGLAETVRCLAGAARRIASVCTGAFILAEAGLLDHKTATTHWRYTAQLQKQFPRIRVDGDRIFTRDEAVWTSAGISAGIDLALALTEDDLGLDIARATARDMVVYHRRTGGQSQFSTLLDLDPESDRIRAALAYAREHLHEKLSVERLAAIACLSARQFGRAFANETGETPAKAVERLRAEAARVRIETSSEPIEVIARQVGFADPERMRRAFLRLFGQPPQSIRRTARAPLGMAGCAP